MNGSYSKAEDCEEFTVEQTIQPVMTLHVAGQPMVGLMCGAIAISTHRSCAGEFLTVSLSMRDGARALFQPFTANQARSFAAGILRAANELDGGRGRQ